MGAAAPHAPITCKALKGKCTAEHSLNIVFIVNWMIFLKTISITHSCINPLPGTNIIYSLLQRKIYITSKLSF